MRIMLLCVLALAVGCGGGGTTMATAELAGTVYEVDGQSLDLAGVQVTLKETGEWAWTDAVGSFEFGGLEPGVYTLDFMGDGEGAPGGDEFSDGAGDPKVDVPAGDRVEIRVALENGEVKDFSSDCDKEQSASGKLNLTDAAELEGYRVGGAIKIADRDDGTLFKVCVEGLEGGAVIEILVSETSIGTATADGDGRACLVLENDLPLGAADLGELAGLRVDVYLSGTDLRLLVGEVPEMIEEQDGDDGDKPDEDGDKPDGSDGDDGDAGEDDGDKPNDDGTDGKDEGDGEDGDKPDGSDGDKPGDGDKPDGDGTGDDGEGDNNEGDGGDESGEESGAI
jgi:hypothetical protein